MKIKLTETETVDFELKHHFSTRDTHILDMAYQDKKHMSNAITALLLNDPENNNIEAVQYLRRIIDHAKAVIGTIKTRPIKTTCSITFANGETVTAFSKISEEDANWELHSRKVGRQTALRNLIITLEEKGIDKQTRTLVADKLKSQMKS